MSPDGKEIGEINHATASEVRKEFSDALNRVSYRNEAFLIEKRGRPIAALVPYGAFKLLQSMLQGLEDRLDSEAIEATSSEDLLDFDVVAKEIKHGGGPTSGSHTGGRRKGAP